ncbi:prolyl oligopeptidase family serine peptidase [Cytophagales bacterium LB-30]|uniref:Prolyl oligopeptidase family serine peptidase n=1 Tax=Shiella aurantiaca TaxID=3058365 RepID=A0ABT8F779_9BACT|nr:alpha/beta fold hydrolase [Shiella aurantiaca]MDN4166089.1 prolyl oligopeptidase family serine peptidase [Shiella aurantiaca]
MKNLLSLSLLLLLFSCNSSVDWEERRGDWEPFRSHHIQYKQVDYLNSPYARHLVDHQGEQALDFMKSLDLFSIAFENDGLLITGFLIQPKGAKNTPVIVFHRGGNRDLGLLKVMTMMDPLAEFALKGYSVVAINYRGNSASQGADEFGGKDVNDLSYLLQSLNSLPGLDATRVALLGISRGGMMCYQLMKQRPNVKAVAIIGGLSNLLTNREFHPEMKEVFEELIPGYAERPEEVLKERSVFYWTEALPEIPLLLFHGRQDVHIDVNDSRALVKKLQARNYPIQYYEYDDNHGVTAHREEVMELIMQHFDKHLDMPPSTAQIH